LKIGQYFDEA